MKNTVLVAVAMFLGGMAFGALVSNSPLASASTQAQALDPSDITFVVSVDEVAQNFVFGERFSGKYERTVTMSDGSERAITLTPMEKNGRIVVRFQDGEGHTYMGPNGWTYNGELLVNLRNFDQLGPKNH